MEGESNLPPSKHWKYLSKCYVVKMKILEKKLNFCILSILREQGKNYWK